MYYYAMYPFDMENGQSTRHPSNLRLTAHECVHLVMRAHFRLHEKDGGHMYI